MSGEQRDGLALRRAILDGRTSAEAEARGALERIERTDDALGAFLTVEPELALARARELDGALAAGAEPGPLFGIPIAVKANLCLEGFETSCGSRMLAGWRAPYTASSVRRVLDAGAVPVGTTNMDEFAMGSSCENSAFGPTRNPWDPERIPGGSSGGGAAAVAAGLVPLALGSDTGGSVRQPAALCGVFGFKPTYGRVSRYGLVAFGSSLDQVSPFARSARDLEALAAALSGPDERDSTCLDLPPIAPEHGSDDARLDGLRLGVPREWLPDSLDARVRAATEDAIARLVELGAERVDVHLPHTDYAIPAYYVVATAEASSNLARYDGVRYGLRAPGDGTLQGMIAATRTAGFGAEVKRRILLGTHVLSSGYYDAWYGRALKVRTLVARDFEEVFAGGVDAVVGPTSPVPAFPLGERTDDPVSMYLCDVLTVPASLAGLPAVSVPAGLVPEPAAPAGGLPVGLQIVGPRLADARVLRVARAFAAGTDHHLATPEVFAGGAA